MCPELFQAGISTDNGLSEYLLQNPANVTVKANKCQIVPGVRHVLVTVLLALLEVTFSP